MKSILFLGILALGLKVYATTEPIQSPPPDAHTQQVIEKLFADILSGAEGTQGVWPEKWTKDIVARELDIQALSGKKYASGRAYGAVSARALPYSFAEVSGFFAKGSVPEKLVRKVKTLVNISAIRRGEGGKIFLRTEIDVPVVSNFRTEVEVVQRKASDLRWIVEWKQFTDWGSLTYNQGVAVIEPDGGRTKMTVVGVHIIGEKDKIPWIGRATASSFAKSHYSNFIRAVDALEK